MFRFTEIDLGVDCVEVGRDFIDLVVMNEF